MKRILLFFVFAFVSLTVVSAQSARIVTDIIESEHISYSQAAYLCALQSEIASEDISLEDVHSKIQNEFYGSERYRATDELNYSNAAYLLAKTYNVKKSLLYIIVPSPRYAFKMLQSEGIIDVSKDPLQKVSGHDFLFMFSNCMDKYGE